MVQNAQDSDLGTARKALEVLYKVYWPPLYAYLRRRGYSLEESHDLLQAFFTHLLEDDCLKKVSEEQGRFRAFMLACLKNLLADEHRRQNALKRGAGRKHFSLDVASAERRLSLEPREDTTPEDLFERGWALTTVDRALGRLRAQYRETGDFERFERMQEYLTGDQPALPYRETAADLNMSEDALRQAVHRLRRRYGRCLRAEISETVAGATDVDDEVRHLLQVLRAK